MPYSPFELGTRLTILTIALGFMALEYGVSRLTHRDSHAWRESAASFGVGIGQVIGRAMEAALVAVPFALVYQHRLFDFDQTSPLALVALFLGSEFFYYWHHRASHRIRWMWATHAVHHSATKMNLTAAVRLGWTGNISGNFLFYLPLIFIGFHPLMVLGMLAINLLYQFFIHTELVGRLGPLEWILNTPAHHCVHHASNASCLDMNYGGVLIVFDRLFGTFAEAPRDEALRYGTVGGRVSHNPFEIAFAEWRRLFREATEAPSLRARLKVLFGPPG